MAKSIVIVGGGIAGLSAGCYARMNGYRSTIFEMHTQPGGLCTSWQRNGYTIDGCIHWLVGSSPEHTLYQMWDELGALSGRTIVDHDEFARVQTDDGRTLIFYTDADRLEEHLLELCPERASMIRTLTRAIRKFRHFGVGTLDAPEVWGWRQRFRALSHLRQFLPGLVRYGRLNLQQYAERFEDEFLRRAFAAVIEVPDFPMIGLIAILGWMHGRYAGYPVGGSLEFSRAIERRYRDLGGEIRYESKVDRILVENDRAVGVRQVDGSEIRADYVISAADWHATLFELLDGQYLDNRMRKRLRTLSPMPPLLYVSLGVAADLSETPPSQKWLFDRPLVLGGSRLSALTVRHFGYDPTLAPEGTSVLNVMAEADYDHWHGLSADRPRYDAEKQAVAETLTALVEERFPTAAGRIDMIDVATPHTFERYTGNWRGSWEGWLMTTKNCTLRLPTTLRGLGNFRMIGQWIQPGGGIPPAALSGRQAVQIICREDGKRFVAEASDQSSRRNP
jgi:phytoene dehydrogenase-like protein